MIPKIKKILYATDLTENSSYAFRYALDLAQWREAKIVILHVIEPVPGSVVRRFGTVGRETEEQRQKETVELIERHLRQFCKNMEVQMGPRCHEIISDILVSTGHAAEVILNTADEKECDLIVLGTHGKGFLAHTFLGSVSSAVLLRTRKPVLIVPLPSSDTAVNEEGI